MVHTVFCIRSYEWREFPYTTMFAEVNKAFPRSAHTLTGRGRGPAHPRPLSHSSPVICANDAAVRYLTCVGRKRFDKTAPEISTMRGFTLGRGQTTGLWAENTLSPSNPRKPLSLSSRQMDGIDTAHRPATVAQHDCSLRLATPHKTPHHISYFRFVAKYNNQLIIFWTNLNVRIRDLVTVYMLIIFWQV